MERDAATPNGNGVMGQPVRNRVSPQHAHMRAMPKAWDWLRDHAEEYVGRWVALKDDVLVADAPTFKELRTKVPAGEDVLVLLVD